MARHVVIPESGGEPAEPFLPPSVLADRWYEARDRVSRAPGAAVAALVIALVLAAGAWWLLRPGVAPIEQVMPRAPGTSAASGSTAGSGSGSGPGSGAGSGSAGAVPGAGGTTGAVAPGGADAEPTELVVQASGAVARPGVYRLPTDARVDDLVRRAGGLTAQADPDRVNLAAPLADGARVWLPRRGEGDPPEVLGQSPAPAASPAGGAGPAGPAAPVDLNTATAEQLDTLPGVGPATGTAILSYREEHGRFGSVDELLEVRGIGDAKLEQLRPLVTV